MGEFRGFPPQAQSFLKELAANNRRDWFEGHRQDFAEFIQEPARAFTSALGERLQEISPRITYDPATNGRGSIQRLQRDTRFSKDKSPYNTYVDIAFWQEDGDGKRTERPGFYFHMTPDSAAIRVGMHEFPKALLGRYRQAVAENGSGGELQHTVAALTEAGCQVGGEHYKRVPVGYDRDHERAELLRYNGLYSVSPPVPPAALVAATLVDDCFALGEKMAPIYSWLVRAFS